MTVAGLVLAAGAGTRYGRPKALVELAGERLVDRAVRTLGEGGITTTYVVQGAADLTDLTDLTDLADPPGRTAVTVVDNAGWREGMGSSLRAGLSAIGDQVTAVVVVPVDQPGLTAAVVRRVVAAAGTDPRTALVTATYAGRGGHPVLLGRAHWAGVVAAAVGDVGARPVLAARAGEVLQVECGDLADGSDVDTPADLRRFSPT